MVRDLGLGRQWPNQVGGGSGPAACGIYRGCSGAGPLFAAMHGGPYPRSIYRVAGASVLHPEHCQQQSIQRMRRRSLSKRTETHRETVKRHAAALV